MISLLTKAGHIVDGMPFVPQRVKNIVVGVSQALRITEDLTAKAEKGKLCQIFGRDELVDRLISIICTGYGFGILVGPPGSGKTSLIEHLAWLTAQRNKPESLENVRILRLQKHKVEAPGLGPAIRNMWTGGVETIFQELFDELEINNDGTCRQIVFIDEIHELLAKHPDVFVKFKQELSSRKVFILGATTEKQVIDRWAGGDAAMSRRQLIIPLAELSKQKTVEVLQQKVRTLEPQYAKLRLTFTVEAFQSMVHLSLKAYPKGVLPDTALKVFYQVIVYAGNNRVQDVTDAVVAGYLATTMETTSEALLAEYRDAQEKMDNESNFPQTYFPEITPLDLVFLPKNEERTAQLQQLLFFGMGPSRSAVIHGRSACVLRSAIDHLVSAQRTLQTPIKAIRCSFQFILDSCARIDKMPHWVGGYLKGIDNLQRGQPDTRVLLHIEDADELLKEMQREVGSGRSTSVELMRLVSDSGLAQVVDHSADQVFPGIRPMAHLTQTLGSSQAQPEPKNPILKHFTDFLASTRVRVVFSSTDPSKHGRLPPVIFNEMQLEEVQSWLAAKYFTESWQAPLALLVMRTALQMQLPQKLGLEDQCAQFLEGMEEEVDAQSIQARIIARTQGFIRREQLDEMWSRAGALDRGVFEVDHSSYQTPPESDDLLDAFLGGAGRILWIEERVPVQREFMMDSAKAYLRSKGRILLKVDLTSLRQFPDEMVKDILKSQAESYLSRQPSHEDAEPRPNPVLFILGRDFERSLVKDELLRLVNDDKFDIVCFAEPKRAPIATVERRSLLAQSAELIGIRVAAPHAEAQREPTPTGEDLYFRCPQPEIAFDDLVRFLVNRECLTVSESEGPPPSEIPVPVMQAFIQAFSHLKGEDGLKLDEAAIAKDIKSILAVFRQRRELGSLQVETVINRIHSFYKLRLGWSQLEVEYIVDPSLTPVSYRIYRASRAFFVGLLALVFFPFKAVFSVVRDGCKGAARKVVDGMVDRLVRSDRR